MSETSDNIRPLDTALALDQHGLRIACYKIQIFVFVIEALDGRKRTTCDVTRSHSSKTLDQAILTMHSTQTIRKCNYVP